MTDSDLLAAAIERGDRLEQSLAASREELEHARDLAWRRYERIKELRAQAADIATRQRKACADQFRDDDTGNWAAAIVRETKLVTEEPVNMTANVVLTQFIIYESPADYPGRFVVREWRIREGGALDRRIEPHAVVATLDEARASIPEGMICLTRSDEDEPQIREVWT